MRHKRAIRRATRALAWDQVEVKSMSIPTNGTLLFQAAGDYSQPRCSIWFHEENHQRYGDCAGICPFTDNPAMTLGMGNDTPRQIEPCQTCEYWKVIPRA
jgi:hypothetical protein